MVSAALGAYKRFRMIYHQHAAGAMGLVVGSLTKVGYWYRFRSCILGEQVTHNPWLITRYRRSESEPHPSVPGVCWLMIPVSVSTIFVCAILPFFRILRKFRWTHWVVVFILWLVGCGLGYRGPPSRQEDEGQYCDG
jgi:hypothetical protein